jgi:hypothetical protein
MRNGAPLKGAGGRGRGRGRDGRAESGGVQLLLLLIQRPPSAYKRIRRERVEADSDRGRVRDLYCDTKSSSCDGVLGEARG